MQKSSKYVMVILWVCYGYPMVLVRKRVDVVSGTGRDWVCCKRVAVQNVHIANQTLFELLSDFCRRQIKID